MNVSVGGRSTLGPAAASRRSPGAVWLAAVVILGMALAVNLSASPIASFALRAALARSFGTPDVAVTVRSWPAPSLWWGNIGMLSVAARSVRVGRLDVAAFDAIFNRLEVDPAMLYGRRELMVRSIGSGTARVTVTEDDIARLVAAQPAVKQVVVHLRPGTIRLDGIISVLGADFPASVTGHLAVHDAAHLDLVVDRVTVLGGLPIPSDVASQLSASVNPVLDVGRLPFGLRLTAVTIGNGVLTLQASAGPADARGVGR
jgi:hypothetical protein